MNDHHCIFCKIIRKEIPSKIAFENEEILAFHDISPQAPTHIVFVPKKHIKSLREIGNEDSSLLGNMLLRIRDTAKNLGFAEDGYRIVNNTGKNGGQTVFHIHFHLLAERQLLWPPG
ncbi:MULTISPECIES: histidine triad nucleotide-binding protein [Leptospira]|uniref:Scavenger mRNA decapping enzyme n=6 Tax=Leptospira borgpetersenii TaxID=174 RepID=M3GMF8_LEPBO|nr:MULTISPECIES: histidine triad nucleotide-binding protein [Leptospira]EMG02167.1 scavenger mRNA decapping enzyme [Leptospira borgpetersenii str. 200701203]EMO11859.1 scavenger mRNA decapping enzyme [Leptospira borgpetersenii str. Noumea 25]EMO64037.1 scavenger mRNA decapping enzyme [Leptospira borgpetersenii serovar Pomona str. 200901868]ALO26760.1 scavenger mRNA decapping enzyme [Leptospira borgpetersenii serovar Ballum]ANH01300.1 Scavenger mRNA decapping enzyme [Leptospira borgpetersenii s